METIHQDFTVGRDMAAKEGRPFKWVTETDFANERYQIIDSHKKRISYTTARMKAFTASKK